jgi:hypothetical protein
LLDFKLPAGKAQDRGFDALQRLIQTDVVEQWSWKHEQLWKEAVEWMKAKDESVGRLCNRAFVLMDEWCGCELALLCRLLQT